MREAVQAAEMACVLAERRKLQAAREKEEKKKARQRQRASDQKRVLEAAFDGDGGVVRDILDRGLPVDAANPLGITALSEAAVAGHLGIVTSLLERKSNPNSRGEFDRTPLWRAVFSSHLSVADALLRAGADPRLYDTSGCVPMDVVRTDAIRDLLHGWDLAITDDLVCAYDTWQEDCRLQCASEQREAMREVDGEYEAAARAFDVAQRSVAQAAANFRDRQKENGIGLAAGEDRSRQAVNSAADMLAQAQEDAAAAHRRLDRATLVRLEAREDGAAGAVWPGREVLIAELNNVLMRDIGRVIAGSKRWPLLIDPSDCAKKMVQYAGCSVLGFWRPKDMQPERIRLGLLHMIRAGGVMAVDLNDFAGGVDLELLARPFEEVRPGLFNDINSRNILSTQPGALWPLFTKLVMPDEKGFAIEHFDESRTNAFKFALVTSCERPHPDLMESFDVIRVVAAHG